MLLQHGVDTSSSSGCNELTKDTKMDRSRKMNEGLRSEIQLLRSMGLGFMQIAKEVGDEIASVYSFISS